MVVLDLRCVFLGGRERENIPIRDGVGGSFTVYPGISVEKSLWKSLTKKKKSFHFGVRTVAVCGSWTLIYPTTYKLML